MRVCTTDTYEVIEHQWKYSTDKAFNLFDTYWVGSNKPINPYNNPYNPREGEESRIKGEYFLVVLASV